MVGGLVGWKREIRETGGNECEEKVTGKGKYVRTPSFPRSNGFSCSLAFPTHPSLRSNFSQYILLLSIFP